mmetsp:Transcript_69665/g.167210  ORF Transcript_69665/g.167210 Transcript_69665/m.167210 type:complete len:370 (-) Transcript_69665:140-1249(-)
MAPLESLQSKDLAWISDFIMQQMVIMLRPVMDHLQQTNATVEYAQHAVQRLSVDLSEVRGDLNRTNKYLAILRQGLGAQNEGKCMLQQGLESTTRVVKRLDKQMDSMLVVMRGLEESVGGVSSEARVSSAKQEELAKQVAEHSAGIEALRGELDSYSTDANAVKITLQSNEARLDAWQKEVRELRRTQLGVAPMFEEKAARAGPTSSQSCRAANDPWPQKKGFTNAAMDAVGSAAVAGGHTGSVVDPKTRGEPRRASRTGSFHGPAGRQGLLQEELDFATSASTGATAGARSKVPLSSGDHRAETSPPSSRTGSANDDTAANAATAGSRLPLLAKNPVNSRPPEAAYTAAPRLRFTETMARSSSRGNPP